MNLATSSNVPAGSVCVATLWLQATARASCQGCWTLRDADFGGLVLHTRSLTSGADVYGSNCDPSRAHFNMQKRELCVVFGVLCVHCGLLAVHTPLSQPDLRDPTALESTISE